jgi:protein phosphatase methylesterase 1
MGGAVAARIAQTWSIDELRLAGLVVLDLVEGSALAALPHMGAAVSALPANFLSIEDAIEWSLKAGMLRLRASAELSVPEALQLCPSPQSSSGRDVEDRPSLYVWAAARFLSESMPCWRGWFTGFDASFLGARVPTLLILADPDSLDTELNVALREGRFQLAVVAGAGHAVHEDCPDKVSEALLCFLSRHGLTAAVDAELLQQRLARAKASALSPSRDALQ